MDSKQKFSGPGMITWFDENHGEDMIYVGLFKDQLKSGVGILYSQRTNERYYGFFEKDMYHGPGWIKYADGTRYIGQFKNGLRHDKVATVIFSND